MEREANYTAVGAFVLLVTTMAALFVYWYAGSADARDYARYEIYFQGSVSGLNRGSTVRYLGVEVGRVVAIRIDKSPVICMSGDRMARYLVSLRAFLMLWAACSASGTNPFARKATASAACAAIS